MELATVFFVLLLVFEKVGGDNSGQSAERQYAGSQSLRSGRAVWHDGNAASSNIIIFKTANCVMFGIGGLDHAPNNM
jgi:hypothetical protein